VKRLYLVLAFVALVVLPALALQGVAPITVYYPEPQAPERITPISLAGVHYVAANDIARVFRATKYWRPDLRKLSLRFGEHTMRFTVDAPVVLVDEEAKNLVVPARLIEGSVYLPEFVLRDLMDWGMVSNATWDEPSRVIRFRSPVHTMRQAQLYQRGRVAEVSATLLQPVTPHVMYATPGEIRIFFPGATLDSSRIFSGGVVMSGTMLEVQDGVELRLVLASGAQGYSVATSSNRLRVAVTDDRDLVQSGGLAPLEPIELGGEDRKLRTIVLDAGHGGNDTGGMLGRTPEKDATLDLARVLRAELQDRLGAIRIVMTRDSDTDLRLSRRAEIANEAEGDLFISIHYDDEGILRSGGFRIYALSPIPAGSTERLPLAAGDETAELRPWDSAQIASAGTSMAVGQAIADALVRNFPQTTVSFHTGKISVLEPVASPAVLLECAPPPRGAEGMGMQGYTTREVARAVAQTIQELSKGSRG